MAAFYPTRTQMRPSRPPLQNFVVGLANDPRNFIADMVLPPSDSPRERVSGQLRVQTSGQIFVRASSFGHDGISDLWPSRSRPNTVPGTSLSTVNYDCKRRGLEVETDLDEIEGSQVPVDHLAMDLSDAVTQLRIARELRASTLLFTTGNWDTSETLAGADQWTDASGNPIATADPIGVIQNAVERLHDSAIEPNIIVVGRQAMYGLMRSPAVLSYLPDNTDRNQIDRSMVADLLRKHFDFDQVHFGLARYNTAAAGVAVSLADTWGDSIFVGRIEASAMPRAGGGSGDMVYPASAAGRVRCWPWTVESERDSLRKCEIQQVWYKDDEFVIQSAAGTVIADTQA